MIEGTKIIGIAPQFLVDNLAVAIEYYRVAVRGIETFYDESIANRAQITRELEMRPRACKEF